MLQPWPNPLAKPLQGLNVWAKIKPAPEDATTLLRLFIHRVIMVAVNAVGQHSDVAGARHPAHRPAIRVRNDPDLVHQRPEGSLVQTFYQCLFQLTPGGTVKQSPL